jgi:hypothetical protein
MQTAPCISSVRGALSSTDCCRNGNVLQEFASFLVNPVRDCFGRVNWRSTTDANDSVNLVILKHQVSSLIQLSNRSMLADL